jgi:enterochelin esterase-like enzyme
MKRRHLLLCAMTVDSALAASPAAAPLPRPASGRIERLADFGSRHVAPRHVDVWLPPGYDGTTPHAVLYMHDGQMLYDAAITWNGQAWQADRAVAAGIAAGRLPPAIVVGVWNVPAQRYAEYFPEKALARAPEASRREYLERASNGRSQADAYLRFLVEELKPAIDRRFATQPGRGSTAIAGSSMGGLISLYALSEYPRVFGAAAALSAHWVGKPTAWGLDAARDPALPQALLAYLADTLPAAGAHRIHIDRGSDALDSLYAPWLERAAVLLQQRGYGERDARVQVLEGTGHSERDWAARLGDVLAFVMRAR